MVIGIDQTIDMARWGGGFGGERKSRHIGGGAIDLRMWR